MTGKRLIAFFVAALATAALAAPAQASIGIETFETTNSETQAGGHPDLTTTFALEDPGQPGGGQERRLQRSGGCVRQPQRADALHRGGLRPDGMPAQLAGRHDHDQGELRRKRRIRARHGARLSTWCRRTSRPHASRSSRRRSTSRSRSRSRCGPAATTACASTSRKSPSRSRCGTRSSRSGACPASTRTTAALRQRLTGRPGGLPRARRHELRRDQQRGHDPDQAADQPADDLHRRAAGHRTGASSPTRTSTP